MKESSTSLRADSSVRQVCLYRFLKMVTGLQISRRALNQTFPNPQLKAYGTVDFPIVIVPILQTSTSLKTFNSVVSSQKEKTRRGHFLCCGPYVLSSALDKSQYFSRYFFTVFGARLLALQLSSFLTKPVNTAYNAISTFTTNSSYTYVCYTYICGSKGKTAKQW